MKKNLLFTPVILLTALSAWGADEGSTGFMDPASLLSPSSEVFIDVPSQMWVSWNNQSLSFTNPVVDGNGDSYGMTFISIDGGDELNVPAYIMTVDNIGKPADCWLEVALYEVSQLNNFSGMEFTVTVPEGLVKNNKGEVNPEQSFTFTKSTYSDAPYFTDLSWWPEDNVLKTGNAIVTVGFGGNPVKYLMGDIMFSCYYPDWTDHTLTFGDKVTVNDKNELVIDLNSFTPGMYELKIPDAYVVIDVDGTDYINGSLWLEYNIEKGETPSDPDPDNGVITEAPGTEKLYNKSTSGTFVLGNNILPYMEEFPATIFWSDDNTIYIKDIISTMATGNFVKGTVDGNRITVAAGQLIDFYKEEGYGLKVVVMKSVFNGDLVDFVYQPDITEFSYILDENGGLKLDLPGTQFDGDNIPDYVIGVCYSDDDSFTGFCDYDQLYQPKALQLVTIPEGAEIEPYVFIDEFSYANLVDVAYVDDKLYIRGLSSMLPEATVMAVVNGDTAEIAQNEYLGIYYDMYFIVTKILLDNPDYDENDPASLPFIMAPADATFRLRIDREKGTISAVEDGIYLSMQPDEDNIANSISIFGKFEMRYQDSAAGTPANPTMLEYHTEWASAQGFNDFMFTLSNFSTENKLLETETLFYRIFIDDEPLIFAEEPVINLIGQEAIAYEFVPDEQIFLPYDFNNGYDIYKFTDNQFDIGIYVEGISTIGVQSMYLYEGVYTFSEKVTLDVATGEVTTDSVKEVGSDSPVMKTEFFDLNGHLVSSPSKGIFIMRETREDGTATARKIVVR